MSSRVTRRGCFCRTVKFTAEYLPLSVEERNATEGVPVLFSGLAAAISSRHNGRAQRTGFQIFCLDTLVGRLPALHAHMHKKHIGFCV